MKQSSDGWVVSRNKNLLRIEEHEGTSIVRPMDFFGRLFNSIFPKFQRNCENFMTPFEIEAWTLRIINQIEEGVNPEDSRVELKTDWISPEKVARQIAGHANSARGAKILWLIGVDEKKGIVGAKYEELANWYPEVESYFDGLAPNCFDINIPNDKGTVVALLFDTDRAPFVVKNVAYGKQGGGSVELEVPWREGNKIRSARRSDLIRLLEPLIHCPTFEILECTLSLRVEKKEEDNHQQENYKWYFNAELYLIPLHQETIAIPFHKCSLLAKAENLFEITEWTDIRLAPPSRMVLNQNLTNTFRYKSERDSLTINSTRYELIAHGPGFVKFSAESDFHSSQEIIDKPLEVQIKMLPVGMQTPIVLSQKIFPTPITKHEKNLLGKWTKADNND
ncbi:MAG: hypothetical protein ABTQ25_12325 [Nitrosomonas ureae]